MEDFDTQMEKEKARLNRFIGVKELNNKAEIERNEKLRKSILNKEKTYQQKMKKQHAEWKQIKMEKFDKKNMQREEILRKKGRDIIEQDNEVFREHYVKDMRDIKQRLEEKTNKERKLSEKDYTQFMMKTSQSQPPRKYKSPDGVNRSSIGSMAFYSNHQKNYSVNPMEVEHELNALEMKGKRGKDINRKEMAELSRKAQEKREKEFDRFYKNFEDGNYEELTKISEMYLNKQKKENMIKKMRKDNN